MISSLAANCRYFDRSSLRVASATSLSGLRFLIEPRLGFRFVDDVKDFAGRLCDVIRHGISAQRLADQPPRGSRFFRSEGTRRGFAVERVGCTGLIRIFSVSSAANFSMEMTPFSFERSFRNLMNLSLLPSSATSLSKWSASSSKFATFFDGVEDPKFIKPEFPWSDGVGSERLLPL